MAGHSKFKNIMHRKGRADAARSKLFSKLSREITVAAKNGLPDPAMNPALRLAVNNAKAESLPKDVIDRAIKKSQMGDAADYSEIRYEGVGPGGVGIVVEVLTDNKNRAAANVRSYFTKLGGNMGATGSVAFNYDRVGQITYPAKVASEDAMMEAAIDAGADDVTSDMDEEGEGHTIYTAFESLNEVAAALEAKFGAAGNTKIAWRPKMQVPVTGEAVGTLMKLLDMLNDDDDVQAVYSNGQTQSVAQIEFDVHPVRRLVQRRPATVSALAAHARTDVPGIQVDADDRVDRVDERDGIGPGALGDRKANACACSGRDQDRLATQQAMGGDVIGSGFHAAISIHSTDFHDPQSACDLHRLLGRWRRPPESLPQ